MDEMNTDSFSKRQEEELQVLESIFGDDFEDLRNKDSWKVPRPPEIVLHLKPQESMSGTKEVHACVSLKAKFSPNYPDSPPDLTLQQSKRLSDDVLKNLKEKLVTEARDLAGEVMILQLSQTVQEVLHKYNKPALSIYEENMLYKRQLEAKEKLKHEENLKRKQDNQRREIEEEINRRREEERKIKKEMTKRQGKSEERVMETQNSGGSSPTVSQSFPVCVIPFNSKTTRQIYKGKIIGRGPSGCVVHIGIDKELGCPVAIHEWSISCPARKPHLTKAEQSRVTKYLKAVKAVEQELTSLLKLHHKNLVSYVAMRFIEHEDHIQVDLLQEFVAGISLQTKLNRSEPIKLDFARAVAEELLTALDYLHTHSVVHKNIKASCIFLDSSGVIRLSDFSIGKRLADLYKESHIEQPGVTFTDDSIPARISKKGDILKLGMLLLSLLQGHDIKDYPPDIPAKLPSVFLDFLNKCLSIEDRLRLTAAELLEHGFIKPAVMASVDSVSECRISPEQNALPCERDSESPRRESQQESGYHVSMSLMASRLHIEFEEMQWLGKGGFGDVVKVRNKLDGRFYAIKRILLDPRRSQFNKKITREVKLLSRLNHENVVRYYNSWIEELIDGEDSSESASSLNTETKQTTNDTRNSLGLLDNIEQLAPPPVANSHSGWTSKENFSFVDDADDEDDEDDMFSNFPAHYSEEEESVLFEEPDQNGDDSESSSNKRLSENPRETETIPTDDSSSNCSPKRYLYIQMEYCEKNTLREAINDKLCHDKPRMWRLFRETLEGLVHIHEQGMIHRDLKPQNIFLDSSNHIKIGDFGLATSHTLGTATTSSLLDLASSKSEGGDSALTGRIGTALYVAPELNRISSRTVYDQKVDMYSLGIIFFEMFYDGMQTKMERVKVLGNLRTEEIRFPEYYDEIEYQNETAIAQWCLNHKPEKRPTAEELLKILMKFFRRLEFCTRATIQLYKNSDPKITDVNQRTNPLAESHLVPSPALEEWRVVDLVRQAIHEPHSRPHRLVMQELFSRPDSRKDDVVYDIDVHKYAPLQQLMQERVHSSVKSILRRHGAVRITPPLLAPRRNRLREELDDEVDESRSVQESPPTATFMDTSGTVVTLPYDLRVPFARYISRNGICNLKRYAIEKVFRPRKIHRSHPKELWECAFDIVTPTVCNLIPDAEGISAVAEIISAFTVLSCRSYKVIINHVVLLHAIFAHSGIPPIKYEAVQQVLADAKAEKLSKTQIQNRLIEITLTNQQTSSLCSLIDQQGPLNKIQSLLKTLTRNKHSPASSQARQALHELEALRKNLDAFGVRLPVIVHLGFVHNLHQYCGIIFQVYAEVQKQKRNLKEVLAVGGRYDELVQRFYYPEAVHMRSVALHETENFLNTRKQCAFGVSIAVEKIVSLSLNEYQNSQTFSNPSSNEQPLSSTSLYSYPDHSLRPLSTADVLVTVVGRNQLIHERIRILRNLWDAGICAEMTLEGSAIADSLENLQDIAAKRGITHLVILKDKDNSVKVRSRDHMQAFTRQHEKVLKADDLVDYLLRKMKDTDESTVLSSRHNTDHYSGCNGTAADTSQPTPTLTHSGTRHLNIDVLAPDKLAYIVKRRYETQVVSRLSQLPILHHISGKAEVYVLAVDLPANALKTFAVGIELGRGEEQFSSSVATVISQSKYRKYFAKISESLSDAKFHKEVPIIILYSYKEDIYKILS